MTKTRISTALAALLLLGMVGTASAASFTYVGAITAADGAVAGLLCGDTDPMCDATFAAFPDGVPFGGVVDFNADGSINTLWFQVGEFFFGDSFTGNCLPPTDATCMVTDPAYENNPFDPSAAPAAFAPIRANTIMSTVGLVGGFPTSGAFSFVAFSPTFGFDLGTITGNLDDGSFALDAGFLGGASGTGAFVGAPIPIPAAAWLFGSALIGLAGLRRRS
ncbi:MAG: VPLPA-CTERM sorting domain-containing protein [Gammaproteobacteria bacterium]|nr:VPLPA-CTERM sorting domain-containing protein [Gammaproteobacteria bacterium]